MNIIESWRDPELFGQFLPPTFAGWFVFVAALFGLPLRTPKVQAFYQQCTGQPYTRTRPAVEGWLICGRRAGKSFVLALIAVYLACFRSYAEYLAPGERATIAVIATDRRQARVIFRYIQALLTHIPMLKSMVVRETASEIELSNAVTIEVATATFKGTRGYSYAAVLLDEVAYFPNEDSVSPDYELLDALRPGMSTIPGAMLLCASSPYAKRGALWDAYRRYFGQDDPDVLVWHADTRTMNPTVPQSTINRAMERDESSARAEYLAQWRTDVESYISLEAVEAVVSAGIIERPPQSVRYTAFVDPSGGQSDSMTLAIAHRKGNMGVLDCLRERQAPFSPEDAVEEFSQTLKRYKISTVIGDRYGGEWPRQAFRRYGISYKISDKTKNEIYREFLPLVNSGECDLLGNKRLIAQLVGLERRTSRGGRDTVDHAPSSHDDLCNSAAGAVVNAVQTARGSAVTLPLIGLY